MRTRRLLLLLVCLCIAGCPKKSAAQTAAYTRQFTVTSTAGRPVPGAKVYVCTGSATVNTAVTPPCTPAATIYSDFALSTPITQPKVADAFGNVLYYVPAGTYTEVITGTGINTSSVVLNFPASSSGATNLGQLNGGTAPASQTFNFNSSGTSVTLPLIGNGAVKPATGDAIRWVTNGGSDTNDGLSRGSGFATITKAWNDATNSGASHGIGVTVYVEGPITASAAVSLASNGDAIHIICLNRTFLPAGNTNGIHYTGTGTFLTIGSASSGLMDGSSVENCNFTTSTGTQALEADFANGKITGNIFSGWTTDLGLGNSSLTFLDDISGNTFDDDVALGPSAGENISIYHNTWSTTSAQNMRTGCLNSAPADLILIANSFDGCQISLGTAASGGHYVLYGNHFEWPIGGVGVTTDPLVLGGNHAVYEMAGNDFLEDTSDSSRTEIVNYSATNSVLHEGGNNISPLETLANDYIWNHGTGSSLFCTDDAVSTITNVCPSSATLVAPSLTVNGLTNGLDDIGTIYTSPAVTGTNKSPPAFGSTASFCTLSSPCTPHDEIFDQQLIVGAGVNPTMNWSLGFSAPVAGSTGQHSISFARGAGLTGQGTPWTWILPTDTFGVTFNHALTANRAVSWPDFAGSVPIASGVFTVGNCIATAAIDAGGLPEIGDGGPCGSGGGSPGGTNTAVQFNNAAAFGGDAVNFSYDPTAHHLSITGAMTTAANSFVLSQLVNPSAAGDSICGNSTPIWADCVPGVSGRTVTGTTDTLVNGDRQQMVTYNSASAVATGIASAATLGNNYVGYLRNENAGTVTITPSTSTINGASSATLPEGYHATLSSQDNTNYFLDYSPGLLSAGANITLTQTPTGTQIAASGVGAFAGGSGSSFQDVTEIASPANPAAGVERLWADSTSHTFSCKTSSGSSCSSSGGGATFGGTNTQTSSYTLASSDAGKLVVMNCAAVCNVTAPATQPSTSFSVYVMSTNSNATFVLGGTDTYNGTSVVPLLLPFSPVKVSADSATATNYIGAYNALSFDGAHTVTFTPVSGTTAIFTAPSGTTPELLANGTNVNAAVISQSGDVSLTTNSNTKHIRANDGFTHASTTVTFSATPAFNAGPDDTFEITLTGNVTSSTITNLVAGEHLTFTVCQDATGGRTFVWPTSPSFRGVGTIGSTASTCSTQRFWYDGTNMFALSPMVTGE